MCPWPITLQKQKTATGMEHTRGRKPLANESSDDQQAHSEKAKTHRWEQRRERQ